MAASQNETTHEGSWSGPRTAPGMGAVLHEGGVTFRVWAPFADEVHVVGGFNDWKEGENLLSKEGEGYWATDVAEAEVGDEYKYLIHYQGDKFHRIDPYARQVTHSSGNAVVTDAAFDWEDEGFGIPHWNALVIYEMHVGTFADPSAFDEEPGSFELAIEKLPYLRDLGINAIEVMPPMEFSGGFSWGYNLALPFAIESEYGGPKAFKAFVNAAHQHGIAVILDVVYNHFGPSDLDLWRFDGWHEDDYGGIYFYNDYRAETPWGKTRPDYGRDEVRQYLRDNALMWITEYHVDGLRWDMTSYIRDVDGAKGSGGGEIPDGWSLMQWVNEELHGEQPAVLTIAEDLRQNDAITADVADGGAGFGSQWAPRFAQRVRPALISGDDEKRDLSKIRSAVEGQLGSDTFDRVVYIESHDEVANGQARIAEEIWPGNARSWFSKKRSTLGAALVFTAPGIPMIFQGQEFMEDRWFDDRDPLDWSLTEEVPGIVDLYRDLIRLRRDLDGITAGLTGQGVEILHVDPEAKILAYHRWADGGPHDSTIAIFNFSNDYRENYTISFPREGLWKLRFNSHAATYSDDFDGQVSADTEAKSSDGSDGPAQALISIAPYSVLIYSQDE